MLKQWSHHTHLCFSWARLPSWQPMITHKLRPFRTKRRQNCRKQKKTQQIARKIIILSFSAINAKHITNMYIQIIAVLTETEEVQWYVIFSSSHFFIYWMSHQFDILQTKKQASFARIEFWFFTHNKLLMFFFTVVVVVCIYAYYSFFFLFLFYFENCVMDICWELQAGKSNVARNVQSLSPLSLNVCFLAFFLSMYV